MSLVAPAPTTPRSQDLASSFHAFTRISRSLEKAYDRLREQAAKVDLALAETNHRLAEKVDELDATTGHLRAVLGSLKAAVVVTDLEGRITLGNRAFEELTGLGADALKGRSKASLLDREGAPICEPAGSGAATPPRVLCLPAASNATSARRHVRSSRSRVVNGEGSALGEVEVIVDETEVEALRAELRRRETLTALGEMAAGIAHELRNPLNAVEGFAHLLARQIPQESVDPAAPRRRSARDHAELVIQGVRKANSIITNLLCFARPDRFRPRRVRVSPLLAELRHAFAEPTAELASVTVEPAQPRDLEVAGDLTLLERVLVNLIENARVAAGEDGHVVVRARAAPGDSPPYETVLCVEDDGPGIPAELRGRLFQPFASGRPGGTGLGLFLVHRIVELHRGSVEVESRSEGGTRFLVRLPASQATARAPVKEPRALAQEGAIG